MSNNHPLFLPSSKVPLIILLFKSKRVILTMPSSSLSSCLFSIFGNGVGIDGLIIIHLFNITVNGDIFFFGVNDIERNRTYWYLPKRIHGLLLFHLHYKQDSRMPL